MKKLLLPVLALPAFAALSLDPDTSGPYRDSTGRVWEQLPSPDGYASFAEWDALFANEVFTTRDGHSFQIDRTLSDEEIAVNRAIGQLMGGFRRSQGSGNGLRASVSTNNPVDEEYRALYSTTTALKNAIFAEVADADAAMNANWGIDIVPTKGKWWDSSDSADIVALLDEAFAEHGYAGLDMMNAWSADPTPGGAIGVAYIGLPRALVKKYQGWEGNILEHEIGHTYTLQHCCDGNCTMQAVLDVGALGGFHNYVDCSGQNHFSTMNNQKNRY